MNVDSLTRAFIRGAALAVTLSACGETAPTMNDGGGTPPKYDGGGTPPKYDPVPSFPGCVGPDYGDGIEGELGYYGQCCADVRCTQTEAGVCPESPPYAILPPGSGQCECEENLGPFAPRNETDDCCYVVYEIGCDGRPLKRDGAIVIADVVARADWMGDAKRPAWS